MFKKALYPKTTDALRLALADSYALLIKTQNYHWNVTGRDFHPLHKMFEEQYLDLFEAVDILAERIRALGALAPGSYTEFSKLSKIVDGDSSFSGHDMVNDLLNSHAIIIQEFSKAIDDAESEHDTVSEDIFIDRLKTHEKTRWMLEATLEGWKI